MSSPAIKLTARKEQLGRLTQLCALTQFEPERLLRTAHNAGEISYVTSFEELTPDEAEHLIRWTITMVELAIEVARIPQAERGSAEAAL